MGIQIAQNWSAQVNAINSAVPNQMYRVFYVDAVNGSDANDGSADYPFQTLSHAISLIPTGGLGYIFLKSDIEYSANTTEYAVPKDNITVLIRTDPSLSANSVISFVVADGKYRMIAGNNNRLWLYGVDLNVDANSISSSISLFMWNTHIFLGDAGVSMEGGFGIYNCNISIATDSDYAIYLINTIPFVRIVNSSISYNNSTGNDYFKLCNAFHTPVINFEGTWSINVNGADLTGSDIASHIVNLVRDADGKPRNILSNIVL